MEESMQADKSLAQYLSFVLDGEVFAISVASIREIIDSSSVTRIPKMPEFMCGVINLRGSVVPVVDMCVKFDIGRVEPSVDNCIVVIEVRVDGEITVVGALVDAVQEVFEIEVSQLEPAPKMGTRLDTSFIEGIARRDDALVIVLNPDRVFSLVELDETRLASGSPAEETEGQPNADGDAG